MTPSTFYLNDYEKDNLLSLCQLLKRIDDKIKARGNGENGKSDTRKGKKASYGATTGNFSGSL
jgi:hypothetical protein